MKVTAILKGLKDTNGHQPIQIRIYHNGKRTFKPTHIKVDPELFKKGKVLPAHPKAKELNDRLKTLIIQNQATALEGFKKKVPKTDFYGYTDECIKQWSGIKRESTLRQIEARRDKLKGFAPTLLLTDVDSDFLYRYQQHLFSIGNHINTVWTAFTFVKMIVRKAFIEGLITENPFVKFKMPQSQETEKIYLTQDEVKDVDKFCLEERCPPTLFFIGTWFLIACHTGLRLSDLKAFDKKKNIIGGRLIVRTQKTREMVSLPISDKLRALFERIDYRPMTMTGEGYNRLLKILVMGAGIDKKVSSHTARHTAAMAMANAKISQEVAQKVLGHKKIATTSIYYKISNQRIDDEFRKMQ
jgi:site-specific recombinase XerD